MDRLCDEIIQIILNELDDPTSFSQISKRYHQFTQDPYVRASYFLTRYGPIQAFYWALGRGKLMNERVVDILLSSGAHLSRYLVQCAIHHYFRTQVPFIKTAWVRTIPLPVFTYFMTLGTRMYGNIPVGKGDDDGSIFTALLKSSRFPIAARLGKWETLKEVLEKYKFIPFCHKDPMMAQFPLVLAIEPRLLPYARANGFQMDRKYRNFVFRKMFEKPAVVSDSRADEIVRNVRELSRLDTQMFLSRTVAAEICMEAKANEPAYAALKRLDKEGVLKFELSSVVEELTKLFINTRSICTSHSYNALRELHADFPSSDPTARLVLLCTVFFSEATSAYTAILSASALNTYASCCHERIEGMGLGPVTRQDLFDLLVNKFTPDRFDGILQYGRTYLDMGKKDIDKLTREVAIACLEVGCKGKMLKKLVEMEGSLLDVIASHVLHNFQLNLDDLPSSDDEKACRGFEAPLCRDFMAFRRLGLPLNDGIEGRGQVSRGGSQPPTEGNVSQGEVDGEDHNDDDDDDDMIGSGVPVQQEGTEDLGLIGQDTLTAMIRKDEMAPSRRRRFYEMFTSFNDSMGKLTYPQDYLTVGRWIRNTYGRRSAVTAIFMLHAVLNENAMVLQPAFYNEPPEGFSRVPVTLKHFKMLARLGRAPNPMLFDDIEAGTEFYFSEEDYLTPEELAGIIPSGSKARGRRVKVKTESVAAQQDMQLLPVPSSPPAPRPDSSSRGKKRPRRSAAVSVKSYVVPDSDDEDIREEFRVDEHVKKRRSETNLQRWIKHLTILHKEEQRKYKEKKKREQANAEPGVKTRMPKNEFFKSLTTNLARLRKADREKRKQLYGADVPSDDYSEGEEDEYHYRTTRSKRPKVEE